MTGVQTCALPISILPDIDAIPFLFGAEYYDRLHHTFGHNVFLGVPLIAAAAWFFRGRPPAKRLIAVGLVALCWASHILTDLKLSGWQVYLFWPFSHKGYEFRPMLSLGDPINFVLVYSLMGAVIPLAFWKGVTPLEMISVRLDRLVTNNFRKKLLECAACTKRCNNRCDRCEAPVCPAHARLRGWFRIACASCGAKAG